MFIALFITLEKISGKDISKRDFATTVTESTPPCGGDWNRPAAGEDIHSTGYPSTTHHSDNFGTEDYSTPSGTSRSRRRRCSPNTTPTGPSTPPPGPPHKGTTSPKTPTDLQGLMVLPNLLVLSPQELLVLQYLLTQPNLLIPQELLVLQYLQSLLPLDLIIPQVLLELMALPNLPILILPAQNLVLAQTPILLTLLVPPEILVLSASQDILVVLEPVVLLVV